MKSLKANRTLLANRAMTTGRSRAVSDYQNVKPSVDLGVTPFFTVVTLVLVITGVLLKLLQTYLNGVCFPIN